MNTSDLGASSPLNLYPIWITEANQTEAYYGTSVASAGDVNGDGYADVIIGARQYSNVQSREGAAFLYSGSSIGLQSAPSWKAESNRDQCYFGSCVASAGDVNKDGYDDVIVGASGYGNIEVWEGAAFLYMGSASGLSQTASWMVESNEPMINFGSSVATAGDVNGDGYDDVIVGAPHYKNGESDEGRAYLFLGSAGGLSTIASWMVESNKSYSYFGGAASAGDINGDGYGDVIVSAPLYENGEPQEGGAYIYLGSNVGLPPIQSFLLESNHPHAYFGGSVASAGDVNGDGYGDVIVGASGYSNGELSEGRAYLFMGFAGGLSTTASWITESNAEETHYGSSIASAGDVNMDGYGDVIVAARYLDRGGPCVLYLGSSIGLSPSGSWSAKTDQDQAWFGPVASAGDVNGDGYEEVVMGASSYENGESYEGRAYIYSSINLGTPTPTPTIVVPPPSIGRCETLYVSSNIFLVPDQKAVTLRLWLCDPGKVSLFVYNSVGERVKTLRPWSFKDKDYLEIHWNGDNDMGEPIASGVYIIRFEGSLKTDIRRLLVLR